MQSVLERVVAELLVRDKLLRVNNTVHEILSVEAPPLHSWFSSAEQEEKPAALEDAFVHDAVQSARTPPVTYAPHNTARYEHSFAYRDDTTAVNGSFYVHVPSWVRVSRAPFHTFGPSLFGLAYTSTGEVHIRDDLEGDEFSEVLQHEVFHQLYPNCSEGQIRQFTLARFGQRAAIHHRIGPGQ